MSLPPIARVLLAAAVAILVGGSVYGTLAYDPLDHADRWLGPREGAVRSGACSRKLRLLPTLEPRPPDFILYDEQTYVRDGEYIRTPSGLRDTRYRYRNWRLLRTRDRLYLERIGEEGTVLPYARGECP